MIEAHRGGDSLRMWRRSRQMTASTMAGKVGVHADTLLGWERTSSLPDAGAHHGLYLVVGEEALWWWPLGELERFRRREGLENTELVKILGCSHARLRSLLRGAAFLNERERRAIEEAEGAP